MFFKMFKIYNNKNILNILLEKLQCRIAIKIVIKK